MITHATHGSASRDIDWPAFEAALRQRRALVYDYLDSWPGAAEFKPVDIHDALFSYVRRRGKGLRPLVLLLACGAVGGDEARALPAAAAVEVFHTWTLVHDDIIDRDDKRRGSPTVHAFYAAQSKEAHGLSETVASHYGTAVAILAGDLQQSWSYALLCDLAARGVAPALVLELVNRMARWLTPELMEGEMLDVQYSLVPDGTLNETGVLEMLSKKTSTLLKYAAWAGARIGLDGRPDSAGLAEKLGEMAYLCGTAFQMHDDLLGLSADEAKLGKPVGADLREGKRTLVVFKALAMASPAERDQLMSVLGNRSASASDVRNATQIIHVCGAYEQVQRLADEYINHALKLIDALPETFYRGLLAAWATYLLAREH